MTRALSRRQLAMLRALLDGERKASQFFGICPTPEAAHETLRRLARRGLVTHDHWPEGASTWVTPWRLTDAGRAEIAA